MPYQIVINNSLPGSPADLADMCREFNLLRAELDDMRAKYAALVALLVASTALGAGYSAGTALGAKQFTPT